MDLASETSLQQDLVSSVGLEIGDKKKKEWRIAQLAQWQVQSA